ncbi:methionyl-tRNA formyltransferase [Nocardia thraciensis]
MRIVSFGFQTWGRRTLQALIDSEHEVVLAVTHPPSEHSDKGIWSDSVEELAREHGIPVHLTESADTETVDLVKRAEPDITVVNGWYTRMPPELCTLPTYGTLRLHDSLLPKFAGRSSALWALISGESESGLTVYRMDDSLDGGDILVQRSLPIAPDATGAELVLEGLELIPGALREALIAVESGTAEWKPQKACERTYFHERSERDSRIDWRWDAIDLERFVRALSEPYPRAFSHYRGEKVEITAATLSESRYGGTPGLVVPMEGGGVVACGPDAHRGRNRGLLITRVRTAGGVEHDAAGFFVRGGRLTDLPEAG